MVFLKFVLVPFFFGQGDGTRKTILCGSYHCFIVIEFILFGGISFGNNKLLTDSSVACIGS
jgi:hypothetical protein